MSLAQILVDEQIKHGFKNPLSSVGYYVYAITKDEKVVYIGKGKKNRVLNHFSNSSNNRLYSEIKNNKNSFNWFILSYFDEEIDALHYEYNAICDAKSKGVELYNKMHFSNSKEYSTGLKLIYYVLKQFEDMWFKIDTLGNEICPKKRAELFIKSLKDEFDWYQNKPMYKNKSITDLSVSIEKETNWYQIKIA